jgi:hypothetical protein
MSYIYCERLNLLLRNLNDLATTTGVRRGKSKAGTLSKRLEKPDSHPEQNLDLRLRALKKVGCRRIFQVPPAVKHPLKGFLASFLRPNANRLINREDKDYSVANLSGASRTKDRVHRPVDPSVRNDDFKFHFGHERSVVVLAPCVDNRVPSLAAKSFDFRDRHPLDPNCDQGILYFIHFKRLYDRFDLLHPDLTPYYALRRGFYPSKLSVFRGVLVETCRVLG